MQVGASKHAGAAVVIVVSFVGTISVVGIVVTAFVVIACGVVDVVPLMKFLNFSFFTSRAFDTKNFAPTIK